MVKEIINHQQKTKTILNMGGIQQPTTNLMKGKNNNINSQQQPTQGLVSIGYSKVTKADVIQVNE